MSAAAPLLHAAGGGGVGQLARSASGITAKAARGFQVFRVDGYSLTTMLPGGERMSSDLFVVGGRHWSIDYYPNGDDMSKDCSNSNSNSIALYLRLHGGGGYYCPPDRVRAHYKFSLLDLDGNAAYERPAMESTFTFAGRQNQERYLPVGNDFPEGSACGHREFITREELERRREALLRDDSLAIRCDVGLVQLEKVYIAPKETKVISKQHDSSDHDSHSDYDYDCEGYEGYVVESKRRRQRQRQRQSMGDSEFIRRCLANNRRV